MTHNINAEEQARLPASERISEPPQWFADALAQKPHSQKIAVGGKHTHCLTWDADKTERTGIVLLHGNGAHAHWFDFIAPLLLPDYRVFTMDMPGMGDSDWFANYSRESIADMIAETIQGAGFAPPFGVVAHSFGGLASLLLAHRHPQLVPALMVCDFLVRPEDALHEWFADRKNSPPHRIYPDQATALGRFRLMPPQPCGNEFILEHIAKHSVREIAQGDPHGRDNTAQEAGWTWKFDPNMFDGFLLGNDLNTIYRELSCALALLFGEYSAASERPVIQHMRQIRADVPYYEIPRSAHHMLLDSPRAFASIIRAQMANWQAQGVFTAS